MQLEEYSTYDALGLAELVRSGQVSAAELRDTALEAAARLNPKLNAIIETWRDEPLPTADANAPFEGVPFLVKDAVLHMKGRACEAGSRLFEGLVLPEDSHLMTRFRKAGLVTIGRTACPEMAFSPTTEPEFRGPTRNPWGPSRSSGGSSGGAAAAVAAGIVPLAHANDGGGSTRIPAACCGVFGLKPSRGRVSIGPDMDEGLNGFGAELAVSRSVRDSAALLDAVHGPAPGDPYVIPAPQNPYLRDAERDPEPLRIAVMEQAWGGQRTTADVAGAVRNAAGLCQSLGHEVEAAAPDLGVSWDEFILANARVWTANLAAWCDGGAAVLGRAIDERSLETPTLAAYRYGKSLSAGDLLAALDTRNRVSRTVAPFFSRFDMLLTPTMPEPPLPLGTFAEDVERLDGLGWTHRIFFRAPFTPLFNMTGQPAISVPLSATADGLPIGIQFAAAFGREDLLFRLAGQLERAAPWAARRPRLSTAALRA